VVGRNPTWSRVSQPISRIIPWLLHFRSQSRITNHTPRIAESLYLSNSLWFNRHCGSLCRGCSSATSLYPLSSFSPSRSLPSLQSSLPALPLTSRSFTPIRNSIPLFPNRSLNFDVWIPSIASNACTLFFIDVLKRTKLACAESGLYGPLSLYLHLVYLHMLLCKWLDINRMCQVHLYPPSSKYSYAKIPDVSASIATFAP